MRLLTGVVAEHPEHEEAAKWHHGGYGEACAPDNILARSGSHHHVPTGLVTGRDARPKSAARRYGEPS